jgi:hypothetical protein
MSKETKRLSPFLTSKKFDDSETIQEKHLMLSYEDMFQISNTYMDKVFPNDEVKVSEFQLELLNAFDNKRSTQLQITPEIAIYYLNSLNTFSISLPMENFSKFITDLNSFKTYFINNFVSTLIKNLKIVIVYEINKNHLTLLRKNATKYFEKSYLGTFLYLNYIQKMNPNLCITITPIEPLIKSIKNIFNDLTEGKLTMKQLEQKYPRLNIAFIDYVMRNKYVDEFVLTIINQILENNTPYINLISKRGNSSLSSMDKSDVHDDYELNISNTFEKLFNICKESSSQYIVVPVLINILNCNHMSVLFIDKKLKEIERFEPNGSIAYNSTICPNDFLDKELEKYFSDYKYISPKDFCPYYGPQQMENLSSEEVGFCVTWSFLYTNERLMYSDRKIAASKLAERVLKAAKEVIWEENLDDYEYVMRYFDKRIGQILNQMDVEIQKINKVFGTGFKLDQRTLLFSHKIYF